MALFGWPRKADDANEVVTAVGPANEPPSADAPNGDGPKGPPKPPQSMDRRVVYSVRVRPSFKSEVLWLVAKRQLQSQPRSGLARRVTEGELVELMLDTYKTFLRNGELVGRSVAIPTVVWEGLEQVAHELQIPVADAFEHLVVAKLEELRSTPRK